MLMTNEKLKEWGNIKNIIDIHLINKKMRTDTWGQSP